MAKVTESIVKKLYYKRCIVLLISFISIYRPQHDNFICQNKTPAFPLSRYK